MRLAGERDYEINNSDGTDFIAEDTNRILASALNGFVGRPVKVKIMFNMEGD